MTVGYSAVPGSATASDFLSRTGILTIPAGESSADVGVDLVGDDTHETTEAFQLVLSAPSNAVLGDATGTASVLDDDTVEISIADVSLNEGDAAGVEAELMIALSRASDVEVRVSYATQDGEAMAGDDYQATSGTAVFAPGETEQILTVPIVSDLVQEPRESFTVVLSAPVEALLGDPEAVVTVVDEDGTLFSALDVQVFEGNDESVEILVPVELNRVAEVDVSVDFATEARTAQEDIDFLATSGTLIFPVGTTRVDVPVTILPDLEDEGFETFALRLTNPINALVIDPEAIVSIADDDRWVLNGLADPTTIPGCYQMTHVAGNQTASAWRTQTFDLTENFDQTFRMLFGYKDSWGGMTFSFQNRGLDAQGGTGYDLGYSRGPATVTPSIGVELDHRSPPDHIAIISNGQLSSDSNPPTALEGGAPLADSREHELRAVWNAATKTFTVAMDGSDRLTYTRDVVAEIFGGETEVLYGFTAGGSQLVQYFCETETCHGTAETPSVSIGNVSLDEGSQETTQFVFPVTLSCPSDQTVTVDFATRDARHSPGWTTSRRPEA